MNTVCCFFGWMCTLDMQIRAQTVIVTVLSLKSPKHTHTEWLSTASNQIQSLCRNIHKHLDHCFSAHFCSLHCNVGNVRLQDSSIFL